MRSKIPLLLTALVPPLLAACGGGKAVVRVMTQSPSGDMQPAKDLVVRFLPFDRDSVFDALAAKASAPEPEVPEDLKQSFQEVAQRQSKWRNLTSEWSEARDSLEKLSKKLQAMDRRSKEYLSLFKQFNALDDRVNSLEKQKSDAFAAFDSLQKKTLSRADSMRAVQNTWEDKAFQDYNSIVDSLLKARGKEIHEDTTGSDGYAAANLSSGGWWVTTRYALPFKELYWNVPVAPGKDTLQLTPKNAKERTKL